MDRTPKKQQPVVFFWIRPVSEGGGSEGEEIFALDSPMFGYMWFSICYSVEAWIKIY